MERRYKYQYKIQVLRAKPSDGIMDTEGRVWKSATNEMTSWDLDEDVWYCWFPKGDCPEESEEVILGDDSYIVENVYWYNRLKRAVIILN